MTNAPRLYVGTYGKYNNGSIAGKWLDLSDYDDAEDFFSACADLHKDEHDPEYMFQDFENFPKEFYSESMGSESINKIIEFAKLDDDQREMYEAFYDAVGYTYGDYDIDAIEDALVMQLDGSSFSDTEQQLGEYYAEVGAIEIPENIAAYFDYQAYGRDLMDNFSESGGYIFDLGNI